jgi:alpha-tubulin suppressor-like RCC1 family protein
MPNFSGMWTLEQATDAISSGLWLSAPGAPTSVTATAGNASASVAFTAPTNTGNPAGIASYTVTSSPGGITATGASSPIVVTGLTNGTTYTFTVTATATNGLTGPASAASNSVTPVLSYSLFGWGRNVNGQLGLNNTIDYSSPKQVGALTTWLKIAGGFYISSAIKADGTLWTWGKNNIGQLGLSNTTYRSSPVQVGALTNWAEIGMGYQHTVAVKTDGTLWVWGDNNSGQLGLGNTTNYSSPKQVGSLANWSRVAASAFSTMAVKTNGTLWAWGDGAQFQTGLGSETDYSSPKQVGSDTNWSKIYGSGNGVNQNYVGLKTDGTFWVWGNNGNGQLGLGDTTNRSSPVQVGSATWIYAASGGSSMVAIKSDGTIWSVGNNNLGQLGLGNTTNYSSQKQIGALTNWSSVASTGENAFVSIKTNGTLWGWGYGSFGQLGQSNTTNYSSPVQVGSNTNWAVVSGDYSAVHALKS